MSVSERRSRSRWLEQVVARLPAEQVARVQGAGVSAPAAAESKPALCKRDHCDGCNGTMDGGYTIIENCNRRPV